MTTVRVTIQRVEAYFTSDADGEHFHLSGSVNGRPFAGFTEQRRGSVLQPSGMHLDVNVPRGEELNVTLSTGFAGAGSFSVGIPTSSVVIQRDVPRAQVTVQLMPVGEHGEAITVPRGAGGTRVTV